MFFVPVKEVENLHIGAAKLGVYGQFRWGNGHNLGLETKKPPVLREALKIICKDQFLMIFWVSVVSPPVIWMMYMPAGNPLKFRETWLRPLTVLNALDLKVRPL